MRPRQPDGRGQWPQIASLRPRNRSASGLIVLGRSATRLCLWANWNAVIRPVRRAKSITSACRHTTKKSQPVAFRNPALQDHVCARAWAGRVTVIRCAAVAIVVESVKRHGFLPTQNSEVRRPDGKHFALERPVAILL